MSVKKKIFKEFIKPQNTPHNTLNMVFGIPCSLDLFQKNSNVFIIQEE
jgi:hypothetical protein